MLLITVSIGGLIGRLHPALVHLPIGILLIACILQLIAIKRNLTNWNSIIRIIVFAGMLSAIASAISGFLLSRSDDYDETLVSWHQWMGITLAIVSIAWYWLVKNNSYPKIQLALVILAATLITITGHLGGSLTHGSDYIAAGLYSNDEDTVSLKRIENVQEANVYGDLVQPLLQQKCYSCHGKNKRKGGLRMDQPEFLMKGGKDGKVIDLKDANESEMIRRLRLPRGDDDHMPPKEKSQCSEKEISLLHWWIAVGAPFDKKVKDMTQPDSIKPVLLSMQADHQKEILPTIPDAPVERADDRAIKALMDRGVIVLPVAKNSNYLTADFAHAGSVHDSDLNVIRQIRKQLVWLKLSGAGITDNSMAIIGSCNKLMHLYLDKTKITDNGIKQLKSLNNLHYINLVGTAVTADGVKQLKDLKNLRSVYVYQTKISPAEANSLKTLFPNTSIDAGGYNVPLLATDTMEVKAPPRKQ